MEPQQLQLNLFAVEDSRDTRRLLTSTLQLFSEYAQKSGSKGYSWYYANYTKMIYRALGFANGTKKENMDSCQLSRLTKAEEIVSGALVTVIKKKIPYKKAYQYAQNRLKLISV